MRTAHEGALVESGSKKALLVWYVTHLVPFGPNRKVMTDGWGADDVVVCDNLAPSRALTGGLRPSCRRYVGPPRGAALVGQVAPCADLKSCSACVRGGCAWALAKRKCLANGEGMGFAGDAGLATCASA